MAFTTAPWARSRASATPSSGARTAALYSEELMGVEGFSSDSALLYHHGLPTAIVDSAEWEPPGPRRLGGGEPAAEAAALPDAQAGRCRAFRPGLGRGHRAAAAAGQRRRAAVVRRGHRSLAAVPERHRRRVRVRGVRIRRRGDVVRRAGGRAGRLRGPADLDDPPVGAGRVGRRIGRRAAAAVRDRGDRAHRPAEALPVGQGPVPGVLAVLRAGPARAVRAAGGRGRRTSRCWCGTAPAGRS